MTRKSDGEKIDELEKSVTRVVERLDNTIKALDRLSGDQARTDVAGHDLRRDVDRDLAVLQRDLDELKAWRDEQKRERDERGRRTWAFGPTIVGALVNVFLSALVAYLVSRR